ncbi:MAG TPA: ABC transporter ATP-binding protein [Chloroflexia bacterium]|nr:ABC transporter ATP-binding protein [Chloroflexia bacterium]
MLLIPENYPQSAEHPTENGTQTRRTSEPTIVGIERVSKSYKNIYALRNISLIIAQGEIFGLLGPNGAGKSTLLKLLLGFLHPDDGKITLFGSTNLSRAHSRIGYLPERPAYHGNFTGREYLYLHAKLSGFDGKGARLVAGRALEAVQLGEAADRRIRTYSKGMRQRLGLAVAVMSAGGRPPDLLILDEPSGGLAPEGQVAIREIILECKQAGSTILLCSHQLTEVERICSTVGILRAGRLVAHTRLDGGSRVNITGVPREGALEIAPHLVEYLKNLHPTVRVKVGQGEQEPLMVSLPTGPEVHNSAAMKAAALRAMLDGRWDITSVYIEHKDLESIYLQAIQPQPETKADAGVKESEEASKRLEDHRPGPVTAPLNGRVEEDIAASVVVSEPDSASISWAGTLPTRPVSTGMGKSTAPLPALQPGDLPGGDGQAPVAADAGVMEDR